MVALLKFVESMSRDMYRVCKHPSKIHALKAAPTARSAGRRPNQKVGSFTNMSEQERHELAEMLETELARL